jgi:hypothetical protein
MTGVVGGKAVACRGRMPAFGPLLTCKEGGGGGVCV